MGKRYESYSQEGKFVFDALQYLGLSAQQLADAVGISRETLTRFMQGKGSLAATRTAIYDTLRVLYRGEPSLFEDVLVGRQPKPTVVITETSTSAKSAPPEKRPKAWAFCPFCGASIEDWKYCPCCGAMLRGE